MSDARYFLVTYDRRRAESRVEDLGTDGEHASRVYGERERALGGQLDEEVVLLQADSIETLKHTHSSYFGTAARDLADVLKAARA